MGERGSACNSCNEKDNCESGHLIYVQFRLRRIKRNQQKRETRGTLYSTLRRNEGAPSVAESGNENLGQSALT